MGEEDPADAVEEALQLYGPKLYKVEKSKRFIDTSLKTDYCYYPNGEIVPWSKHWRSQMNHITFREL